MDFNNVFLFNTEKYQINDSEYTKLIEKSLRKLSKVLAYDTFLAYESTNSHIEKFVQLLAHHKKDYAKYYKYSYDKLKRVKKGFYCDKNGFTTSLELEILVLINKIENLLKIEDYRENYKSKSFFPEIKAKLKEFVLETNLIDKNTRLEYQKKIVLIKNLSDCNSFISLSSITSEIKSLEKLKKENRMNYQNLYLRNVNRYETIKNEFIKTKSYVTIKENKVIELQFLDIEKLLKSENYDRFDSASDILDLIEEKFRVAISVKKDRISTYLTTEVDGLKGYVWEEDLITIREGSQFIIAEAQKSNDFNNLNLDKFKKDEKINSKKKAIDSFIKYLIDSSSNTKKNLKAKLANIIKQAETFYRRAISLKEFEEFVKYSKDILNGRISKSKLESKSKFKFLNYINDLCHKK